MALDFGSPDEPETVESLRSEVEALRKRNEELEKLNSALRSANCELHEQARLAVTGPRKKR